MIRYFSLDHTITHPGLGEKEKFRFKSCEIMMNSMNTISYDVSTPIGLVETHKKQLLFLKLGILEVALHECFHVYIMHFACKCKK